MLLAEWKLWLQNHLVCEWMRNGIILIIPTMDYFVKLVHIVYPSRPQHNHSGDHTVVKHQQKLPFFCSSVVIHPSELSGIFTAVPSPHISPNGQSSVDLLDFLKSTTSFVRCWAANHPKVLFAILVPDASTAVWRASGGKRKRYWGVNIALCNSFRFLCLISFKLDFCILKTWSTEVQFRR